MHHIHLSILVDFTQQFQKTLAKGLQTVAKLNLQNELLLLQQYQQMKKIKAGKRGPATKYISRAKAIRKLQVSLKDFRRLCILKGVYPREPPQKLRKTNKVYYHAKDVNFLGAEKLIDKFRQEKIFIKKFKKAKETNNVGQVKYLSKNKPNYTLNHLIRERYPEFVDALRDLDDPLSTLALFSIFPSHKQFSLERGEIDNCILLMRQWSKYIIETRSLRKAFLSIKGIYYQVEIMGQLITYIVPYEYPPSLPIDVDYRVMLTFLEFYETLLKFVMFKLYSLIGKKYPPSIPTEQELDYFHYKSFSLQDLPRGLDQDDKKYEIDEKFKKELAAPSKSVFDGLVFFLNSQVPRYSLQFVIRAAGGEVYWQGLDANVNIESTIITHVITDRQNIKKKKTKEYIQPQWIYDSLNNQILLDVKQYELGKKLPPHLSPFVNAQDQERHVPERQKELSKMKGKVHKQKQIEQSDEMEEQKPVYDILQEEKLKAKKKKEQQKQMKTMAKGVMTSKNRKLMKAIEMSRAKDKRQNDRLSAKANRAGGKRRN